MDAPFAHETDMGSGNVVMFFKCTFPLEQWNVAPESTTIALSKYVDVNRA
jgi:hypothetical protein